MPIDPLLKYFLKPREVKYKEVPARCCNCGHRATVSVKDTAKQGFLVCGNCNHPAKTLFYPCEKKEQ